MRPNENGRRAATTQHDGTDNQTLTAGKSNIPPYGGATDSILSELEEAWPLIPLRVLLLTDASPREVCRALRLNLAIRLLCEAISESEVA